MRVKRGQRGLFLELMAHRGAYHVHFHSGVGIEVIVVVGCSADRSPGGPVSSAASLVCSGRLISTSWFAASPKFWMRRVLDARRVDGMADRVDVGRVRKLHVAPAFRLENPRPAERTADVRPVLAHLHNAGNAKNQRKGKEVPLPSQPVHIWVVKEFHCFLFPSLASSQLQLSRVPALRHSRKSASP